MTHYNISINDELAEIVERLMKERKYANRSEFFRELIRQHYLQDENNYVIEKLDPSDPDYQLIEKMKKEEDLEFIPLDEVLQRCSK